MRKGSETEETRPEKGVGEEKPGTWRGRRDGRGLERQELEKWIQMGLCFPTQVSDILSTAERREAEIHQNYFCRLTQQLMGMIDCRLNITHELQTEY